MPATQEITVKKLGIIAGGGNLPSYLLSICNDKGIEPFIIGFDGQTGVDIMEDNHHQWVGFGEAGKIISFFKSNGVKDLVLIGGVKRPSFSEIKPDFKAVKILSRIGFRALGDNDLLSALKTELEKEGFILRGVQDFCDGLLIEEGTVGRYKPEPDDAVSIEFGLKVSQEIGALDIGQSVIVQNAMIVGVEAVEGTDALIARCSDLQQNGRGGILVKTRKPQQDKMLDMPTIGPQTIINAHNAGLAGIVLHAGNVIIVDIKTVANYADKYKIFVVGVPVENGNKPKTERTLKT
ncbi:MAG: UDP-2,3-diacylglucosamine pyrophosphatase [Zetaproteobacteria bacterium]|nr:MAG: UDP-2,3-diacylglucosamine pyrophosphatase [Zetaproteobacteria bacterium]